VGGYDSNVQLGYKPKEGVQKILSKRSNCRPRRRLRLPVIWSVLKKNIAKVGSG
jgi:hypothetical protein